MRVPFCDLARENTALLPELLSATERVLRSGRVLYGPELEAFERDLCKYTGASHAIGVASGTDAVEIALRCVGAAGKTVSVPAFSPVPCVNAVEAAGATPVLREAYDEDKRADIVLEVPLFGAPEKDNRGSRPAVLDLAHGFHRDIDLFPYAAVAVSFYPSKNLGACGDGGAILTNNPTLAARARLVRHYGVDAEGQVMRGQNSRLSELQAAYLRVKLPHLDGWISRRQAIAMRYWEELRSIVPAWVTPDETATFHCYVVTHPNRDKLRAKLSKRGIGTMVHYDKAIHQHPRWAHLGYPGQFGEAEQAASLVLSLPCYPYLRDDEQDAVIAAVKECA